MSSSTEKRTAEGWVSDTRTYEIAFSDQAPIRITIPASWKVSFGAIVPGKAGSATSGPYGIRIWETTDKQRAVFANVTSFIDMSIPVSYRAVRLFGTGDEDWYLDDGKTWEGEHADKVERAWKPEDEIRDGEPPWLAQFKSAEDDVWASPRAMKSRAGR